MHGNAASEPGRHSLWLLITVVALLVGALVVVATGPVAQMAYGNDVFVLIEGAWRVLQGQRPHLDFNTSLGFGIFLPFAAGFRVFGASVDAIPPTMACLGVIAGVWCWLVTAPRLRDRPWLASALSLVAGTFTYSSFFLDDTALGASYVGAYNHGLHALLVVLAADVLLRRDGATRGAELACGLSSGLIVAVFAVTKQTFLLPSACLVGFAATMLRRDRAWWIGLSASVFAVLVASAIYLRGDLLSVARDFLFVARARGITVGWVESIPFPFRMGARGLNVDLAKCAEVLRLEYGRVAALAIACAVSVWPFEGLARDPTRRDDRRRLLVTLLTLLSGFAVLLSSWHWAYLPVIALLGVYVTHETRRDEGTEVDAAGARVRRLRTLVTHLLALSLCAELVGRSVFEMSLAWTAERARSDPRMAVQARPLRAMPVWRAGLCEPETFGARMTDGLALLAGARDQQGSILVMDYVNPFSFALRRPSPRGDAISWSLRASFNEHTYLPATQVFREVDLVMIPKCPLESFTTELMARLYNATLIRDFVKESESRYWVMLSRRATGRAR